MQLGDRIKQYEKRETSLRFMDGLPIYVRIDGRSFSNFTRTMQKPYDENMSRIMQEVTKYLVKETSAKVGYTQSDEISLLFYTDNPEGEIFFDGKIQKMVSVLAGLASSKFTQLALTVFPRECEKCLPVFDARVFQVPSKVEAMNCFLWRVQDAVKNSISMATRAVYAHKDMNGKNQAQQLDMLMDKGINWNEYPKYFKEGTFFQRIQYEREPNVIRTKVSEIIAYSKFEDFSTEERVKLLFGE